MECKTQLLPQFVQLDQFELIKLSVNTEKTKSKKLLNSFTYMYSVHACSWSELHASPHIHIWIGHTHIWIYMDKTIWENALYVG